MAQTLIQSDGLAPGCITRAKLNTTLAASAVVAKVLAGAGLTLASTGVDAGTGDVTLTGLPASIPANGWYLPAANTLGVATNSVSRGSIGPNGNHNVSASSTPNSIGGFTLNVLAPTTAGASNGLLVVAGTTSADNPISCLNAAQNQSLFTLSGLGAGQFAGPIAVNGGTKTAPLAGFGSPSGSVTSGLNQFSNILQVAGTLAALLAYFKTIGFLST
jgi:hypothetical protein